MDKDVQDYVLEDLLEISDKERDKIIAEKLNAATQLNSKDALCGGDAMETYHKIFEGDFKFLVYPKYSEKWRHTGRLLQTLPEGFKHNPTRWFTTFYRDPLLKNEEIENDRVYESVPDTLSKEQIVLAGCVCAIEGIEPDINN
jgi:hypothetical protein